jgi:CheY-like chemotaxis protein
VLEAADGAPGIEVARHACPDAVIVDAMMPGLDGFETTRSLRALSMFASIPIVGTSASVTHEIEKHFLEVGGNAFLPKPIEMKSLIDLLGLLLGLQWTREPAL